VRTSIPLSGFADRQALRDALIEVHKVLLAPVLGVVLRNPANKLLRVESIRYLDEALWAVTEITRGTKHDCRFVSKDVKKLIEAHNESPVHWTYGGPENTFRGRTDPRKCAEHEHVVPRQQLREQLFAAGPDVDAIEQVLRRARGCIVSIDEHRRLKPHAKVPTLAWERYALAGIEVWDRTTGDWVKM
jgi:hypothetical protein